jgi:hypothetical protein
MRRVLCILLIGMVGCNGITRLHITTAPPAPTFFSITGIVTVVQLSSVPVNGVFVDVTSVTFLQGTTFSTVTFCDDLIGEFLPQAFTEVDFLTGSPCATVLDVVIG